jgi:hypothetical protein
MPHALFVQVVEWLAFRCALKTIIAWSKFWSAKVANCQANAKYDGQEFSFQALRPFLRTAVSVLPTASATLIRNSR